MRHAAALLMGVLLTGILLAFALPPHGLSLLGWFAFVPLLVSARGKGFAAGFAGGLAAAGFAAFLDAQGPLLPVGVEEGSPDWIYAGFLLFGVVGGLTVGLASASENLAVKPWVVAAWAVLFEAGLLAVLPAHLALTQSRSTVLLWMASITGIWGVSYVLWTSNLWLATAFRGRSVVALACLPAFGLLSSDWLAPETGSFKVGLIQSRSQDLESLTRLNGLAGSEGAAVVVWPELSGYAVALGGDTKPFLLAAGQKGQPAFATTYEEPGTGLPYNLARVFSASGESAGYRKRKLFAGERALHKSGNTPSAVFAAGTTLGLNICFDSCYPAIMRDTARLPGVAAILLPTLDPDTPRGVAQAIHASYTPFRAAELGIPIIRADTTSHSMIVDSWGRVLAEAGNEQDRVMVAEIRPGKRWTFQTVAGDWFLGVLALTAAYGVVRRRQDSKV